VHRFLRKAEALGCTELLRELTDSRAALLSIQGATYILRYSYRDHEGHEHWTFEGGEQLYTVRFYRLAFKHSFASCTCPYNKFRGHECKHIAALRAFFGLQLTEEQAAEIRANLQKLLETYDAKSI
jgi:hypothetical protein